MATIKAVIWDFGGVFTSSPFEAFNRFERANNLPLDFIRSINAANPDTNAWAQLESDKINAAAFDELFAGECRARGYDVRGSQILSLLSGDLRPEMVRALNIVRSKFRTACITNNVRSTGVVGPGMARNEEHARHIAEVMSLFETVLESSELGVRKPDPAIYRMACERLGIAPTEAVYLDDLGINLKPARALGMQTIKVLNPEQALSELEAHLQLELR
jgi:putative hydrolase of the HAD superfamily